ncbi:MAG: hypothetical protein PVH68_17185, partial [Armatimonadota bacterium]
MRPVKRVGRRKADEKARSARRLSRREALGALGGLPALGMFSSALAEGEAKGGVDAVSRPTAIAVHEAYWKEYSRLRDLDLDDPAVVAKQRKMPVGRIGNLTMGRLISGSNLISMNMHARDLDYVQALAAHYNTEDRVFMTLKKCEEHGINAIVLKTHNFKRFRLKRYWEEWGGRMQWIADVITRDVNQFERLLVQHLELGASAAYVWGGAADIWYHEKRPDKIVKAFEMIRKHNVPAGIAAHRPEPIVFCEKQGLEPDFYFKTLHHDRYWSAHPQENRRFLEMYEGDSNDHAKFHDNFWCANHEETVAFMRDVKAPWIAFKVLAAGAIPPQQGFNYAFESGADFICVGMFDFQVTEDAEIARKAIAGAQDRD